MGTNGIRPSPDEVSDRLNSCPVNELKRSPLYTDETSCLEVERWPCATSMDKAPRHPMLARINSTFMSHDSPFAKHYTLPRPNSQPSSCLREPFVVYRLVINGDPKISQDSHRTSSLNGEFIRGTDIHIAMEYHWCSLYTVSYRGPKIAQTLTVGTALYLFSVKSGMHLAVFNVPMVIRIRLIIGSEGEHGLLPVHDERLYEHLRCSIAGVDFLVCLAPETALFVTEDATSSSWSAHSPYCRQCLRYAFVLSVVDFRKVGQSVWRHHTRRNIRETHRHT